MISKRRFGIGIDTGGTYTDAVLMDLDSHEVLAAAKKPTTHHDLRIGLDSAVNTLLAEHTAAKQAIGLVAVSSTLATNATVEDRGANVALLVIGAEQHFELPVAAIKFIDGGFDIAGQEEKPLDIETLINTVVFLKGKVDSYAVVGSMSFVNPAHEQVAAKAIGMIDPRPVFLSHRLSNQPGLAVRAATAVLNARLMPVMETFLAGISAILDKNNLSGNLRVVRGDGQAMSMAAAVKGAASTVGSGPAATAWFGAAHARGGDALVIDVGGTTTDVTMVQGGEPVVVEEGSVIGGWQTHVRAVDMFTAGIGGDSHVRLINRELLAGPKRVVPLCLAPEIAELPELCRLEGDGRIYYPLEKAGSGASEADPVLRFLLSRGPAAASLLQKELAMAETTLRLTLEEYLTQGRVAAAGFTPTDALHVLGSLQLGNPQPALTAAVCLAERAGMTVADFCHKVMQAAEEKIEDAIIDFLLRKQTGKSLAAFWPDRRRHPVLDMGFKLKVPMIGIGAAARVLLPGVARRLRCEFVLPEHFEVGNAIGAVRLALTKWDAAVTESGR